MHTPRTAFPATESSLRAALADAELDRASFERRLAPCTLAKCGGTCCYDGVYVNAEQAPVLEHAVRRNRAFFAEIGLELPERAIVEEETEEGTSRRTALRPRPFRALVPDYPAHFAETACCFLLDDGRCGLQMLAEAEGRHPWHYKPLACWLHPVSISPERIELHDEATDPYNEGEYRGFSSRTHCGRTDPCGRPAREVLRAELEFLGEILGRDLLGAPGAAEEPDEHDRR